MCKRIEELSIASEFEGKCSIHKVLFLTPYLIRFSCSCCILLSYSFSEKAKLIEEKFNKLKDVYSKLREEHIQLIRQV